jgi:iron complex outermembrane receptor protein
MFSNTKVLVNMLYEHKNYTFKQQETALFQGDLLNHYDVTYNFYSPRMGVNYKVSDNLNLFGNISYAQREPADNELFDIWTGPDDLGATPLFAKSDTIRENGEVKYVKWDEPYVEPEAVLDYEAGVSYIIEDLKIKANLYYMDFSNEIVPLGSRDKDGNPIRGNADKTVHSGVEFSIGYRPINHINITGNLAWSKNYYRQYVEENWDGSTSDLNGNTIAGFPDLIGNLNLSGSWQSFSSMFLLKYVGKQYLDNTQNEERIIDPFTRVDLLLSYKINNFYYFPEIRFLFKIINLLDEEYETAGYYDSWAGLAYYYPGAVRNYYFSISFSL